MNSIKWRLFIYYTTIAFVIFGILSAFLYFSLYRIIFNSIDSSLMTKAKAIATLVNEDEGLNFKFSDELLKEYATWSKNYFQIFQNGKLIEKSPSLKNKAFPFIQKNQTITLHDEPLRIVPYDFNIGKRHFTVLCAQDIDDTIDVLQTYLSILIIATVIAILISAFGGLFIIKALLLPLNKISRIINLTSESNLSQSRIDTNVVKELKPLAIAFNRTFERLDNAFKKQKQFVSDVSHELKTPLSVILMETEVALRRPRSIEEYKEALNEVAQSAIHTISIVERLLKLAKIDNQELIDLEQIDAKEIIQQALNLLKNQIEKKNIKVNLTDKTLPLKADKTLILELFLNIIENAIKYNKTSTTVDIIIDNTHKSVTIKDTGIGIAKEDLDKVFDEFYRADKSRSKTIEGVGLGLSLVKKIAKLHNAQVSIDSVIQNGTTVVIKFP